MGRQIHAKEVLIIGDSNVRRNLFCYGKQYAQNCESGLALNLTEFTKAVKLIVSDKYKIGHQ